MEPVRESDPCESPIVRPRSSIWLACSWAMMSACYDATSRDGDAFAESGDATEATTGPLSEPLRTLYNPCRTEESLTCARGDDEYCASYTAEPSNSFCAPLCEEDAECPTVQGFEAACNFAFCALLCDDGECPSGMVCLPDTTLIDGDANDRGKRDVCITAPRDALAPAVTT